MIKKTVIIFDTNILKENNTDNIFYHMFEFSEEYKRLVRFLYDNNLADDVTLAITDITLYELEKQRRDVYYKDIRDVGKIKKRFSYIDSKINLVKLQDDFDIKKHLLENITKFVESNNILVMKIPSELVSQGFINIRNKSLDKLSPFGKNEKSDAGFKDAVIWETILCQNYDKYDYIYFLTRDADYDDYCKAEFKSKFNKNIFILSSVDFLFEELIDHAKMLNIEDVVDSAYFKNSVTNYLANIDSITVNDVSYNIDDYKVLDFSEYVDIPEGTRTGWIYLVVSNAELITKYNDIISINIITHLDDQFKIVDHNYKVDLDE